MLLPIIINHDRLPLVLVGPLDSRFDGVIVKTTNVDQDMIGFANLLYNHKVKNLSGEILTTLDFYPRNEPEKVDLTNYDHHWCYSLVSTVKGNTRYQFETRNKDLLFVWNNPRNTSAEKGYHAVKEAFKNALEECAIEINSLLNEAQLRDDGTATQRLISDLQNLVEWHLSVPIYMSKYI